MQSRGKRSWGEETRMLERQFICSVTIRKRRIRLMYRVICFVKLQYLHKQLETKTSTSFLKEHEKLQRKFKCCSSKVQGWLDLRVQVEYRLQLRSNQNEYLLLATDILSCWRWGYSDRENLTKKKDSVNVWVACFVVQNSTQTKQILTF